MGIDVFMIVAVGQVAVLPGKPPTAGVVFSRAAVTITAPIFQGTDDPRKGFVTGQHSAAFTKGDMMGRVETEGGDVAERTDERLSGFTSQSEPSICAAQGVAAVLDQKQIIFFDDFKNFIEIERDCLRYGR